MSTKGKSYGRNAKDIDGCYEDLIHAISLQAAKDYVWARNYTRKHKAEYEELLELYPERKDAPLNIKDRMHTYEEAKWLIPECERFFRGWWFETLEPGLDGEKMIRRLRRISWEAFKNRLKNVKGEEE